MGRVLPNRIINFFKTPLARFFIKPILVAFPMPFVAVFFQIPKFSSELSEYFPNFCEILHNHALASLLLTGLWSFVFTAVFGIFEECQQPELKQGELLSLIESLERVVGAKMSRFTKFLSEVKSGRQNLNNIFLNITKPEDQIAFLSEGLYAFFKTVDKEGTNFKVGVAPIKNNLPNDAWFCFSPSTYTPSTPLSALKNKESAIMNAIKRKGILIISDTKKESNKNSGRLFIATREATKKEEGSLIAYPILSPCDNKVIYVITIYADRKNYFKLEKKKLYEWYLKQFALRINLEQSLLYLKENAAQKITGLV